MISLAACSAFRSSSIYAVSLIYSCSDYRYYIQHASYNQHSHIHQQILMSKQQQIKKQNKILRETVQQYLDQIQNLKQTNEQHEAEIQTLLKFNERLLIIIETELNNYNSRKSERSLSLQPISEITEKDSEAVDAIGSIKASLINNFRLNDIQAPEKTNTEKRSGHETDRVMLGQHLQDVLSYQISRSDYQKQYSQYSKKQKVKQVLALISAYKQEYGQSIRECEDIKAKIREETLIDNKEIQNLNQQNSHFYGSKLAELSSLTQKMKGNTLQSQLKTIIDSKKYSSGTQNKLMKIMGSIK